MQTLDPPVIAPAHPFIQELRERARNGATLLDERRPGWRERINLRTLDIGCGENCVVAQEYGDWPDGKRELYGTIDDRRAIAHGFVVGPGDLSATSIALGRAVRLEDAYELLNAAWREELDS